MSKSGYMLYLKLKSSPGLVIGEAFNKVSRIVRLLGISVEVEFNELALFVHWHTTKESFFASYDQLSKARAAAYRAQKEAKGVPDTGANVAGD